MKLSELLRDIDHTRVKGDEDREISKVVYDSRKLCEGCVFVCIKGANFDGMDALLATVQMPSGIPVATVAIDGAKNAAILAVQMLAITDESLAAKLEDEKVKMLEGVKQKDAAMQEKIKEL